MQRVHAHGRALHVGRSLALSSCDITDPAGALLAHATSRCIVFRSPEGRADAAAAPPRRQPLVRQSGRARPVTSTRSCASRAATVLDQAVWDRMSGLDVLRAQIAGALPLPPLHHLLGLTPVSAEEGSAECVMPSPGG